MTTTKPIKKKSVKKTKKPVKKKSVKRPKFKWGRTYAF